MCEYIKGVYFILEEAVTNRTKLDIDKQTMCDKRSFLKFDLSRVKMVSYYSDVERLELVRDSLKFVPSLCSDILFYFCG